jgi:signal transduction histidine kinase
VYPPALAAHGPGAAIEAIIRRSRLRAVVQADDVPRLPEPVERTIFFCSLEALQNVTKHAGRSATAVVRIRLDGYHVEFAVEDDGVGFPAGSATPGTGLANLADRIAAHGGTLRVRSEPGAGTTITGRIDLTAGDG